MLVLLFLLFFLDLFSRFLSLVVVVGNGGDIDGAIVIFFRA